MTNPDLASLAQHFETHRAHLGRVAYRMLGSHPEAEDAVQEAWLRLSRSDGGEIDNLGGWLTTVVARVCLDTLRSRAARREGPRVPDVEVTLVDESADPERERLLADSVGLALLVVLDALPPAERLAFVLHDMFAMPFEDIAGIVGRTPTATRKLASRARARVQEAPPPDGDLTRQRAAVEAFLAASRAGDFEALLGVLAPDVVLRADRGAAPGASRELHGARAVIEQARLFSRTAAAGRSEQVALVNGALGIVNFIGDMPFSVMGFTFAGGKIVEIDILADPERLARLKLARAP